MRCTVHCVLIPQKMPVRGPSLVLTLDQAIVPTSLMSLLTLESCFSKSGASQMTVSLIRMERRRLEEKGMSVWCRFLIRRCRWR